MSVPENSWTAEAHTLGFETEREMLRSLYYDQNFSISQIATILNHSAFNVRKRLIMLVRLPLRQRGGPNRTGKRILAALSDEKLFGEPPRLIALEFNVHLATVFAEKRLREKGRVEEEIKV